MQIREPELEVCLGMKLMLESRRDHRRPCREATKAVAFRCQLRPPVSAALRGACAPESVPAKRLDILALLDEAGRTTDQKSAKRLKARAVKIASDLIAFGEPNQPYSALANAFIDRLEQELEYFLSNRRGREK
jgi:hypothetical protein